MSLSEAMSSQCTLVINAEVCIHIETGNPITNVCNICVASTTEQLLISEYAI